MDKSIICIKEEIEKLRVALNEISSSNEDENSREEILDISMKLDKLILEYINAVLNA
jgi:hypothetical protein